MTHLKQFGLRLRLTFAAVLKYFGISPSYFRTLVLQVETTSHSWSPVFDLGRKQMTTLLFLHINMPRYYLAQLPHRDRVIVAIGRRLTGSPI